jgi:hypothetical protein
MTKHSKDQASETQKIPKRKDDTYPNGDAKNGTGEDNHHHSGKEESAEDFVIRGDDRTKD